MLVERLVGDDAAWVQLRASHLPKPGGRIDFAGGAHAIVEAREDRFFRLHFHGAGKLLDWLERHGEVPLPPYITRRRRRRRRHALPDRLRARSRRGGRAHRRPALRRAGCSPRSPRRAWPRVRDAARRRRHLPAGHGRGPVAAPHAQRALRDTGGDDRGDRDDARARRSRRSPWARRRCGRSSRRSTQRDECAPARPRPPLHHARATASAPSTSCSPISTCRGRRC